MASGEQIAGAALAAYTLSQLAFLALLHNGILLQGEATERLQAAIDAMTEIGDPVNLVAVDLLQPILNDVKAFRRTSRQ